MKKKFEVFSLLTLIGCVFLFVLHLFGMQAQSPYPIADKIADKVIQKYQTSSCQQLQLEKQQPPSARKEVMEQKAIEELKTNPELRKHFLDKIAAPVVNKMFECGMVP